KLLSSLFALPTSFFRTTNCLFIPVMAAVSAFTLSTAFGSPVFTASSAVALISFCVLRISALSSAISARAFAVSPLILWFRLSGFPLPLQRRAPVPAEWGGRLARGDRSCRCLTPLSGRRWRAGGGFNAARSARSHRAAGWRDRRAPGATGRRKGCAQHP